MLLAPLILLGLPAGVEPPATVPVGAPGEGGVAYPFRAGTFEVTNRQYADFLNHTAVTSDTLGLWAPEMRITRDADPAEGGPVHYDPLPGSEDRPVQAVRWTDAARFANWLHHGRPFGPPGPATTEDGAYPLAGQPWRTAERSPDARWFLLSEHEAAKASRYDPATRTRRVYATGSDSVPTPATVDADGRVTNPGPGTVNYLSRANWGGSTHGNVTVAGDCDAPSPWGTYDMNGNVWEWTDTPCPDIVINPDGSTTTVDWNREIGGGSFGSTALGLRLFTLVEEWDADSRTPAIGLRVGSLCPPDFNADGFLDFFDYADFVDTFETGDPATDLDFNGFVDLFDYAKFVDLFENCG